MYIALLIPFLIIFFVIRFVGLSFMLKARSMRQFGYAAFFAIPMLIVYCITVSILIGLFKLPWFLCVPFTIFFEGLIPVHFLKEVSKKEKWIWAAVVDIATYIVLLSKNPDFFK